MSKFLGDLKRGDFCRLRGPLGTSLLCGDGLAENENDACWTDLGIIMASTGFTSAHLLLKWHLESYFPKTSFVGVSPKSSEAPRAAPRKRTVSVLFSCRTLAELALPDQIFADMIPPDTGDEFLRFSAAFTLTGPEKISDEAKSKLVFPWTNSFRGRINEKIISETLLFSPSAPVMSLDVDDAQEKSSAFSSFDAPSPQLKRKPSSTVMGRTVMGRSSHDLMPPISGVTRINVAAAADSVDEESPRLAAVGNVKPAKAESRQKIFICGPREFEANIQEHVVNMGYPLSVFDFESAAGSSPSQPSEARVVPLTFGAANQSV